MRKTFLLTLVAATGLAACNVSTDSEENSITIDYDEEQGAELREDASAIARDVGESIEDAANDAGQELSEAADEAQAETNEAANDVEREVDSEVNTEVDGHSEGAEHQN